MYELRVKNRDYVRIAIMLTVVCIAGLIISMFVYDELVNLVIRLIMPITPNSLTRKLYMKVPFPLEFHVHIFDIQNPKEVQAGGKPHLKDVGPYVFHEFIEKHDTVDDEPNDTVTFTLKKTWIFKPELSNGLTGDENVTILHPVINAMALATNVNRKPLLSMISDAIKIMFKPTTPFWTGRAMDLMFDGIPIDCSSINFKVKAICSVFETGVNAAIQPTNDDGTAFKLSLLGGFNDSFNGRFQVYRGKKDVTDTGRIVEVDEQTELDAWFSDEENHYRGTDGYFIPPFRTKNDLIWTFQRTLCISLGLEFDRNVHNRGVPLRKFRQNLDRFADNEAFCRENGSCPIQGTLDLFNCIGVPFIATLPHFFDAHPSLLENVQSGLHPNKKHHEIFVNLDMKTGVPLIGSKRLQLNFELCPIRQVEVMKDVPSMVFPFVWFEERLKLPTLYVTFLHSTLILTRRVFKLIEYLCLSIFPIAAIVSLTIHILIGFDQIQVIDRIADSASKLFNLNVDTLI